MEHMHHDTMSMQADSMLMTSSLSLNLPMNRDGSGTSWQPDESPEMMYMKMYRNTALMFHGAIFIRYTSQDILNESDRGGQQFDAPNWFMFRLQQKVNHKDLLTFTLMNSLDVITEGGNGYPLLFQTGETYEGKPLVDRQHPHDLFSALSISYTHSFNQEVDLYGYFGYPGEPALGPNAFMHRISAMNNPDAPLGHHWQDATHITFGVGTMGLRYKMIKIEGSIFTGREPDETRYDFDKPRFDSYSYRISANPNANLSLQFSQGFITSPEALEPESNILRSSASVLHTNFFNENDFIATTLAWGLNHLSDGENLNTFLFESNLKIKPLSVYARYEFVQKNVHELQLEGFTGNQIFNINVITVGLNRKLITLVKTDLSAGLQGAINFPGEDLASIYGNYPVSIEVYLKIAPAFGNHSHGNKR